MSVILVLLSVLFLKRTPPLCGGFQTTAILSTNAAHQNPIVSSRRQQFQHAGITTTTCYQAQYYMQQQEDRDDEIVAEHSSTTAQQLQQQQQLLYGGGGPPPIIHHIGIKTRNITTAIQFYSLLGFEVATKFRAGPAKAAWLEQQQQPHATAAASASTTTRLELIEVPSYMLNEPEGKTTRAVDLMQRPELLGHNHLALDVTKAVERLDAKDDDDSDSNKTPPTLADWMDQLNLNSLEIFGKTLRVALEPQQRMIGNAVYELAFIYDADGALLEFLCKQKDLSQEVGSGWEPWDGEGFRS